MQFFFVNFQPYDEKYRGQVNMLMRQNARNSEYVAFCLLEVWKKDKFLALEITIYTQTESTKAALKITVSEQS